MATTQIVLKRDTRGNWFLYAPKGHALAGPYRGSKHSAFDWATAFASTWKDWCVIQEGE